MKRILITGANSYIGSSLERYLSQWPDAYRIDTVDMIGDAWHMKSFEGYDCVFHVAGIAHSDSGRISEEKKALYYRVNCDLAIETAMKAKAASVSQFIFMSSAIVYGESAPIGKGKVIDEKTSVSPANAYGDSKVQAEKGLQALCEDSFKVVILRPPMIYGPGCKGNYSLLSKIARKIPVFPYVNNCRSMIYIDNFMEFVRLMIQNTECGVFWPQNTQYTNTSEMVAMIAKCHGRKVWLIPGFSWLLKLVGLVTGLVNKAFGSLSYDQSISSYSQEYCLYSLQESIELTEKHGSAGK